MGAKDIELRPIARRIADDVIRRYHYSQRVVPNTQLSIGVFYQGRLEGAIQIGPPMVRANMLSLVKGTQPQNLAEINRMAFSEALPRNSESRALAVTLRLLRKHRPQLKWVLSFADAANCGDGTIYRAAGFILTGIKRNDQVARLPNGETVHQLSVTAHPTSPRPYFGGRTFFDLSGGTYKFKEVMRGIGASIVEGHQLRYIGFVDPTWRNRLAVPAIPYSEIQRRDIGMYRGSRAGSIDSDAPAHPGGSEGGAIPTPALQTVTS